MHLCHNLQSAPPPPLTDVETTPIDAATFEKYWPRKIMILFGKPGVRNLQYYDPTFKYSLSKSKSLHHKFHNICATAFVS